MRNYRRYRRSIWAPVHLCRNRGCGRCRRLSACRAWALAIAVAIACTQAMRSAGIVDLTGNPYGYARIELGGLLIGAILFGVGMSLVGTCGFGVLVRAGTGDLRAMIAGVVLGIAAFAATGGLLSVPRLWLSDFMQFDAGLIGSATFAGRAPVPRTGLGSIACDRFSGPARHFRLCECEVPQTITVGRRRDTSGLGRERRVVCHERPCGSIRAGAAREPDVRRPARPHAADRNGRDDKPIGIRSGERHRRRIGVVRGVDVTSGVALGSLRRSARNAAASARRPADGLRRRTCTRVHHRPRDLGGKHACGDGTGGDHGHDLRCAARPLLFDRGAVDSQAVGPIAFAVPNAPRREVAAPAAHLAAEASVAVYLIF